MDRAGVDEDLRFRHDNGKDLGTSLYSFISSSPDLASDGILLDRITSPPFQSALAVWFSHEYQRRSGVIDANATIDDIERGYDNVAAGSRDELNSDKLPPNAQATEVVENAQPETTHGTGQPVSDQQQDLPSQRQARRPLPSSPPLRDHDTDTHTRAKVELPWNVTAKAVKEAKRDLQARQRRENASFATARVTNHRGVPATTLEQSYRDERWQSDSAGRTDACALLETRPSGGLIKLGENERV